MPSTILRVPITFPPEKFGGKLLSAMCVPDLRGTQGTFTDSSRTGQPRDDRAHDRRRAADLDAAGRRQRWTGRLLGPDRAGRRRRAWRSPSPSTVDTRRRARRLHRGRPDLHPGRGRSIPLDSGQLRPGPQKAHGICKLRVTSLDAASRFYVTPDQHRPAQPAMPISHPPHYAMALAKLQGRFATLGLAEDTWALNERVIDEQAFLEQAYAIHEERRAQFFHALDRQPDGVVAVVFDATDRIQHMFFRYLDPRASGQPRQGHRAAQGRDRRSLPARRRPGGRDAGQAAARTTCCWSSPTTASSSFQRGVNLNTWFRENGYLSLKGDPADGPAAGDPRGPAPRGRARSTGRAPAPTPTGWRAST